MDRIIAQNLSTKIQLNDGNEMPMFGLGVGGVGVGQPIKGQMAEDLVLFALENGYRLIDTAEYYENEEEVGRAVKRSGLKREQVFVVTKLKTYDKNEKSNHGYENCKQSFMKSFNSLQLSYVDLYLIHTPKGGNNIESYDAMIELKNQGLIKSIGVSNFHVTHLEELRKSGRPTPAVNQIELHPFCRQQKTVEYCREHGIVVMGFSPLTKGKKLNDPQLLNIASRCKKTPAEVLLRWSLQSGFVTIPRTTNKERIISNTQVFNFSVDDENFNLLNNLPTDICVPIQTNEVPWEG